MRKFYYSLIWSLLLLVPQLSFAQWPATVDSALFVDYGLYPYLVVDESDQSIIVAYLRDNGIWAKKFDRFGYPMWDGNHVVLTDTAYGWLIRQVAYPDGQWGAAISDGDGGVIVAWEDYRNATFDPWENFPEGSEVYLQRVDKYGNICYDTNGKKISGPATDGWHSIGDMKTDYHGGFYIGFSRDSTTEHSVLKHFANDGALLWQRFFPGAFIDVCATNENSEVFINTNPWSGGNRQKLNIEGDLLWPDSLIGNINDSRAYRGGGAFPDGEGGIIGVGGAGFLKIRRIDFTGEYAWDEVDLNEEQQGRIGYTSDNNGGIYVCWTEDSMRIQRIDRNGNVKFNPPLKIHENAVGTYITNSDGGAITIFGISSDDNNNLFAQRLDSSGTKLWPDSGIAFHVTDNDFLWWPPVRMFSDLNDGAIFLWNEVGNGNEILIKQISARGKLGDVYTNVSENKHRIQLSYYLKQNYPNPFNNSTIIPFIIKKNEKVNLKVFNIKGQRVRTLLNQSLRLGNYKINFNAEGLASGVYFYQLQTTKFCERKKMLLIR